MKPEREDILRKLMHKPGMSFNELWEKEGASNKFAYHLKVLEEDGLIEKQDEGYALTHEGKKFCTYVDGETGKKNKAPLIAVIIVVTNGDKILMCQRKKEPFYNYWGFIGGKLEFNEYILECAARELKEETGLTCDLELKGLTSTKTFNNGSISFNHQMFIVRGTNPQGELITKTREGNNKWVSEEEVAELQTFPNVPYTFKAIKNEGFRWIEADRTQEDDKFTGMTILRNERL